MKKWFWIVTSLVLVTAIRCSTGQVQDQEISANIIEAISQVDAHPRPEEGWKPAVVGMSVTSGGQVRTGAASSARLELLEGVVRLAAESIFTVRESTSLMPFATGCSATGATELESGSAPPRYRFAVSARLLAASDSLFRYPLSPPGKICDDSCLSQLAPFDIFGAYFSLLF